VARRVLIVKLAAIGDVVMALPMVSALREVDPASRISWLCGREVAPLLRAIEGIDQLIEVDEAAILTGTRVGKARAVREAWQRLAGMRFDAVYVAHSDHRYRWLVKPVRAAAVHWLGGQPGRPGPIPGRYYGAEYVRLVTGRDDHRATLPPFPTFGHALPPALEARLADGEGAGARRIAIAPGGARNLARDNPLRRWPLERYAALARQLLAAGARVALTGGAGDAWVREGFAGVAVDDFIGATSLPDLVALYRRCAAVVTHDSGPLHLARLAGTAVVGLFGPTLPAAFVPDGTRSRVLWPGAALPCAPCYDGREFAACDDNRCMQLIAVPAVAEMLERTLSGGAP
jgi:heptosyltransferase-2